MEAITPIIPFILNLIGILNDETKKNWIITLLIIIFSIIYIYSYFRSRGTKIKKPIILYLSKYLIYGLITIFLIISSYKLGFMLKKDGILLNLPIKEGYVFDFEGSKSTLNWVTYSQAVKTVKISSEKEFSKSGNNSLCLNVELQPVDGEDWCNVGISNQDFYGVRAIVAWILIPETKQTINNRFCAYITAGVYIQKEEITFKEKEIDIIPGKWNKIYLNYFRPSESNVPNHLWEGTINSITITVWNLKSYTGQIFLDDIIVYTDIGRR